MSLFYPSWWRKHFLLVELFIACALTAVLVAWSVLWGGRQYILDLICGNRSTIYGSLASLFGSLLGFIITAMSIIIGFSTSDRLALLRSSRHYKDLWNTFVSAIRFLGITTIFALIGLVFDRDASQHFYLFIACLGLSMLCVFRVARCIWILEKIVKILIA